MAAVYESSFAFNTGMLDATVAFVLGRGQSVDRAKVMRRERETAWKDCRGARHAIRQV